MAEKNCGSWRGIGCLGGLIIILVSGSCATVPKSSDLKRDPLEAQLLLQSAEERARIRAGGAGKPAELLKGRKLPPESALLFQHMVKQSEGSATLYFREKLGGEAERVWWFDYQRGEQGWKLVEISVLED